MQIGLTEPGRKKPALSKVIAAMVREYWEDFEKNADPELLAKLKSKVPYPQ